MENGILERKPSIKVKKAPPPVRQTLTSYKRMLKANPLLKFQEAGVDIDHVLKSAENFSMNSALGMSSKVENSKGVLDGRPSLREFKKPEIRPLMRTQSLKLPKTSRVELVNNKPTIISGNKPNSNANFKRPILNNKLSKPKLDIPSLKHLSEYKETKTHLGLKANIALPISSNQGASSSNNIMNGPSKNKPKLPPKRETRIKRRSLSAGHIKSKNGVTFDPREAYTIANRSRSHENINNELRVANIAEISPILEESSRNLVFKTPSAYERRSICRFTPQSARRSSLFLASTPAPVEMQRLQERLNQWLKSRGKPLASFHHLRCFDIDNIEKAPAEVTSDEENKENIEMALERSESYDNLNIGTPNKGNMQIEAIKKNSIPDEEMVKVAKEAMIELLKLIEEDYPSAQCLGWLELIRGKYEKAVDEPEYWECRAAIEQSVGNVGNAVEFYKTAIIQGAEVTSVDKSLDQLLKKFSLLNITPDKSKQKNCNAHKARIVNEARNVFKSTIIQFAIQERKLKKNTSTAEVSTLNSKKLIVTPVRRSTRLSRSGFVNTTGVKLCTSLKEINLSKEEIDFEKNTALC